MELSDADIVRFEYVYGGKAHHCAYLVTGGTLVAVVGQMERTAALDRMLPERLARILVHELLVEAELTRNAKGIQQEGKGDIGGQHTVRARNMETKSRL